MEKANINTLSTVLMAPVTIVFFVIIGIIIVQVVPALENFKGMLILLSFLLGLIIGAWEIVHGYKKIKLDNSEEQEELYKEKVRKMVKKAFDGDFEETS